MADDFHILHWFVDFEVIQKLLAARDHTKESPAGVVVLGVLLEVDGEMGNLLTQHGNLHRAGAGIFVVDAKLADYLGLFFCRKCHYTGRVDGIVPLLLLKTQKAVPLRCGLIVA